jgi:hypothetical protein
MDGPFAIVVLIVIVLAAALMFARGKRWFGFGLVVLTGVMLGNVPGTIGDTTQDVADIVYDLPDDIYGADNDGAPAPAPAKKPAAK